VVIVVGLVGGIGSGKSEVAKAFARYGATVISGDEAGHFVLKDEAIRTKVREHWGPGVFDADGEVARSKLAAIVFADERERKKLEELVFPGIARILNDQVVKARHDPKVSLIVVDAAVMLEAGWDQVCDRILYVDASREERLMRLKARGWTELDLVRREKAQWPLDQKRQHADAILENSGAREELDLRVKKLIQDWGIVGCNFPPK
jgi:dephospho-CoA kinase